MRIFVFAVMACLVSPALAQNGMALPPVEVPAARKVETPRPASTPAAANASAAARQDDLDARLARQARRTLRSVCRGCERRTVEHMPPEDDLPPFDPAVAPPVDADDLR